jgi:hypothetical protein
MKILKDFSNFLNENYIHTKQDKIDDMRLISDFSEKFESEIGSLLHLQEFEKNKFQDYLGYGATSIYRVSKDEIKIDNEEQYDTINGNAMVWIETGINPVGVKVEGEYGRTYTVHLELKAQKTEIHGKERYQNEVIAKKFYNYSLYMDEIIEEFKNYVNSELK